MNRHRLLRCLGLSPANDAIGDRTRHVHRALRKVNVAPLEGKRLTLAQTGRGRQKNEGSLSKFEIIQKQLDFGGDEHIRRGPPLRALANELDGIAIKQLIPTGVIKEYRHQVPDFGARASPTQRWQVDRRHCGTDREWIFLLLAGLGDF
jgi:hypothetical protein